jgi:hypothetical protein
MTKSVNVALMGLVAGFMVLPLAYGSEKDGNPLRFSALLHSEFTDNRDSIEKNKQSNTDIYVSPRIDYTYDDGGHSRLTFHYMPSFRYRTDSGDGDDTMWQHDLGIDGLLSLTKRSRLRLYEQYNYNDDSAIVVGGAVERANHSYSENTAELGFNTDIYRYSNLDIALRNNLKRFDDSVIAKTSDETITTIGAEHRYQINHSLRSVLGATYGLFTYDNSLDRDFNSILGKVGLENAFTPNTLGRLIIGWQAADYDNSSMDAKDEPYALASIETRTGEDFGIGGEVSHGIRDTDAYPFSSQTYSQVRVFADLNITPSLMLRGYGVYRLSEYDKDDLPPGIVAPTFKGINGGDDNTFVADILLDYTVIENVAVYLGYRYEDVDSEVGQSYQKNTGRVGASLMF